MISSNAAWARGAGRVVAERRDQQRVQVAVAGVGDVGDQDVVPRGDRLDPGQHLGTAASGTQTSSVSTGPSRSSAG